MREEGSIDCHQAQILSQALRKEKSIEGIARRRLGFNSCQNVMVIDCDEFNSQALRQLREQSKRHAQGELSQPHLDCNLPETGNAHMNRGFGGDKRLLHQTLKRINPLAENGQKHICVEQEPHGSRAPSQ